MKRILYNRRTRQIGKNFTFLLFLQGANFLLPLITLPYLVRVLGTELFGLVIFAQSFALFFNVLVDFGFNLSATREISIFRNDKSELSEIFSGVFLIKIILILISSIIILCIVFFVPRFNHDWQIYLLSFGVIIGQALSPDWYYLGIEKMYVITVIKVLARLIFTILILLLVKSESDYILVPIINATGYIIAGFIGLFYALKQIKFIIPKKNRTVHLFKDSSKLFAANLSVTLYTTGNTIILGLFTNNSMVGIYSSMEKLILAVKNLYTPIFQSIFPWLSSKKTNEIVKITSRLILPLFSFGIIIFIVIFLFADQIINIVYNNKLISDYSNILRILGLIAIFSALNMLFNMLFLSALKKYKERLKIILSAGVFNVVTALILVRYFGAYGIAVTVTFTELLLLLFGWYYYNKIKNEKATDPANDIS